MRGSRSDHPDDMVFTDKCRGGLAESVLDQGHA